jgi:hypothetical protein
VTGDLNLAEMKRCGPDEWILTFRGNIASSVFRAESDTLCRSEGKTFTEDRTDQSWGNEDRIESDQWTRPPFPSLV